MHSTLVVYSLHVTHPFVHTSLANTLPGILHYANTLPVIRPTVHTALANTLPVIRPAIQTPVSNGRDL